MKKNRRNIIIICVAVLLVLICINTFITRTLFSGTEAEEVSYDEFLSQLEDKNGDRVQVESTEIYFTLKEDSGDSGEEEGADGNFV